jgi:hypothetical protein
VEARVSEPPKTNAVVDDISDLDGEDLACLGLRRADDFMDVFADLIRQAHEERVASLPKPPKPRKPSKPTLASVAKAASKAAIPVARYEVKPDGTVVVVTGAPQPAAPDNPWPLDEFRTKEPKQ